VDGERQGRMQSAMNERGCSLIFAERGHFEPEEREDHPPCRMSVSLSDSDREVRRVFWVHIMSIIGRGDLRIRIIDMGLGVQGLCLGLPGWGPGLHLPEAEVLDERQHCQEDGEKQNVAQLGEIPQLGMGLG